MFSGSLCSLFIGCTDVKNTVCLLLKFCRPGINPEFMMECKLIAHPMWWMYSKKSFGIDTLSCNEWSMRLRRYNIEIFSCFLRLLPFDSSTFHQTNVESTQIRFEDNPLISRIQSLHLLLEVDHHDEEEHSVVLTLGKRWANNLLAKYQSKFFPRWVWFLYLSRQKYGYVILL